MEYLQTISSVEFRLKKGQPRKKLSKDIYG